MSGMAAGKEIRDFLTSRRARITPDQVGLRSGGRRRVSGLRREEVALLAGISVEYYTQLERGTVRGVSEDVLAAVARALQLDDIEQDHLVALVRTAKQQPGTRRSSRAQEIRPELQRVLDSMTEAVAFVRNSHQDILSANRLGYAFYAEAFANPDRPVNLARFVFLDPAARDFYADWDGIADAAATNLRAAAGRDLYDRDLTDLVGELSMRSEEFSRRWASHDVGEYRTGTQRFHHSLVGDVELRYEAFQTLAGIDEILIVYTAEADSPSADALRHLADRSKERST